MLKVVKIVFGTLCVIMVLDGIASIGKSENDLGKQIGGQIVKLTER